jgi:hypothetical protein
VYFGRFWEERSGCVRPQLWCIPFDGKSSGVMITHPQRYNRVWIGRGLKVWNCHRYEDFSELIESRDMSRWKMEPRRGLGGLIGYL